MLSILQRQGWSRRPALVLALLLSALIVVFDAAAARASGSFGRGVNILSTDGMFRPGDGSSFSFATLGRLRGLGFDHVRINALPFEWVEPDGRLQERWIRTLRRVIDAALGADLKVVVDVHEFIACQREVKSCEAKLHAVWSALADSLSGYDDRVGFEILNEPGGAVDAIAWNRILARELATIRKHNPNRKVIIGPVGGELLPALARLKLPAGDRNILVDVHYYEPFQFTHQGAPWAHLANAVGVDWGSIDDIARLRRDFATISIWSRAETREIYLGEFGVYEKAEAAPRFCYLNHVVREAEARGWSWSYWQLTSDFALMDERTGRWNDWIVAALMTPEIPGLCAPPVPGVSVATP